MPIITLTTDWQTDDFYAGAIKGHIYSKCPDARIIDITHKIEGFKSAHAAFILKGAYPHFPAGTIHLLCVNSEITEQNIPLCICHNGQYFIGADIKSFGVLFNEKPDMVIGLDAANGLSMSTFPELTIFAEAACLLANGMPATDLGFDITDEYSGLNLQPSVDRDSISGNIIYIDSYKNLITDISKDLFRKACNKRKFEITVKSDIYKIERICNTYSEVEIGELVAIFNSLGLLEIAMRNANLATIANIDGTSRVIVKFK